MYHRSTPAGTARCQIQNDDVHTICKSTGWQIGSLGVSSNFIEFEQLPAATARRHVLPRMPSFTVIYNKFQTFPRASASFRLSCWQCYFRFCRPSPLTLIAIFTRCESLVTAGLSAISFSLSAETRALITSSSPRNCEHS